MCKLKQKFGPRPRKIRPSVNRPQEKQEPECMTKKQQQKNKKKRSREKFFKNSLAA